MSHRTHLVPVVALVALLFTGRLPGALGFRRMAMVDILLAARGDLASLGKMVGHPHP